MIEPLNLSLVQWNLSKQYTQQEAKQTTRWIWKFLILKAEQDPKVLELRDQPFGMRYLMKLGLLKDGKFLKIQPSDFFWIST